MEYCQKKLKALRRTDKNYDTDYAYLTAVILDAQKVAGIKDQFKSYLSRAGITRKYNSFKHADLKDPKISAAYTSFYYNYLFRKIDSQLNGETPETLEKFGFLGMRSRRLGAGLMSIADYSVLASGTYKAGPNSVDKLFRVGIDDVGPDTFNMAQIIEKATDAPAKDYMRFIQSCMTRQEIECKK